MRSVLAIDPGPVVSAWIVLEDGLPVAHGIEQTDVVIELVRPTDILDHKVHHCHSARAKDSNIRQALLDRFGGKDIAVGTKADQGPLYGIKKDVWSALAIGVYHLETKESPDATTGSTDLMPDPEGQSQVDQN